MRKDILSKHPLLRQRLFGVPLAIQPAKLEAVLSAVAPRLGVDYQPDLEHQSVGDQRQRAELRVENGVAIIEVFGSLIHRSRGMSFGSGLTSFEELRHEIESALLDRSIKAIILQMDSPGGEVSGAFDLADVIFNARGQKPIVALVEDLAASAGFLIASAADEVVTTQTAEVGSVGVVAVHFDQSEANAMAGFKVTHVFEGARKIDGTPHAALEGEALAAIQAKLHDIMEIFVNKVSRNLGMNPADIIATEADTFIGERGVEVGFASRVGTLTSVLQELAQDNGPGRLTFARKGVDMNAFLETLKPETVAMIPEADREAITSPEELAEYFAARASAAEAKTVEISEAADITVTELAQVREEKATEKFEKLARGYENLTVQADKFGAVLRACSDKLTNEEFESLEEILNAADAQIKTGKLFAETGTGRGGDASTALEQLNAIARTHQDKEPGMTNEAAFAKAIKENKTLYRTYRAEDRVSA